jgi:hypothetical protein
VKTLIVAWLLGVSGLLLPPAAEAHSTSTSFVIIELPKGNAPIPVRWDLSVRDVIWSVFIDRNFDGAVTWEEVQAARPSIESAVLGEIALRRGDVPCKLRFEDLALAPRAEQNFLSVILQADCPRPGLLAVDGSLFMSGDASQRVLLSATREGVQLTGVLSASTPAWLETETPSNWATFKRFVVEGIWHVLVGYDHIAFVLLLLLPAVLRSVNGQWQGVERLSDIARDIVTIVTLFTVAHSTTLALAVTGTVKLPTRPIEVAIAASIAAAGALNLFPRLAKWRLPLAFGFGFVHGFGFANALSEIDAKGTALLPLLAGFNIGVEVAQLCIVCAVLPLIYFARQRRWYAGGVLPLGSCALGAAGLVWLVQRL